MPRHATAFLHPHIHLARCHDDIVVLNVMTDDYALLVDAGPLVRAGRRSGEVLASPDVVEALQAMGLIADRPPEIMRVSIPGLTGEIAGHAAPLPRGRLARAFIDSLISSADFARAPFAALVETARRRWPTESPTHHRTVDDWAVDDWAVARAVGAFEAIHPWVPFEGDCLQRGYRLHHHLHRAGIPARWVFGVRTWPFLAHCWVQVGDRVVGDTRERVSSFTPIMAV